MKKFVKYIGQGLQTNDWTTATKQFYHFESISDLQLTWLDWVRDGIPAPKPRVPVRSQALSLIGQFTPTAFQPKTARMSAETTGWYAHRSAAAGSEKFEPTLARPKSVRGATRMRSNELVAVPLPKKLRVSSRPQPSDRLREVLIEWGQPSPFLVPTLATSPESTRQ